MYRPDMLKTEPPAVHRSSAVQSRPVAKKKLFIYIQRAV